MLIVLIAAAVVVTGGLFLKWATLPVMLAYELGRHVQRIATAIEYRRQR